MKSVDTSEICLVNEGWFKYLLLYIDTNKYLADPIFKKHNLKVKWINKEFQGDKDYRVIFCKIKKKDLDKFKTSIEELKNKMILLGYDDYESIYSEVYNALKERNLLLEGE